MTLIKISINNSLFKQIVKIKFGFIYNGCISKLCNKNTAEVESQEIGVYCCEILTLYVKSYNIISK
jgi:hypothetical protein